LSRIWDLLRQSESQPAENRPADTGTARREQAPAFRDPAAADRTLDAVAADTVQIPPTGRVVVHSDPRGPGADRFRLLRLHLRERWNAEKLKTLLITSPLPNDGKSTISLNLASALAERGKRSVLLIGADLHQPTLAKQLGLPDRSGLAECLEDGVQPFSVMRRLEPLGWYLLHAGNARGNPTELLQSGALGELIQQILPHFEWVLIDSPPVLPLADALTLRQVSDASLLVVRAGRTPTPAVDQAMALLGRKHVLGIVLNGMEGRDSTYGNYYGYYTGKR
jgi:capsular exopolysaccharide synthesis family protein